MKKMNWTEIKTGIKVIGVSMAICAAVVGIRTLLWMPQIF